MNEQNYALYDQMIKAMLKRDVEVLRADNSVVPLQM